VVGGWWGSPTPKLHCIHGFAPSADGVIREWGLTHPVRHFSFHLSSLYPLHPLLPKAMPAIVLNNYDTTDDDMIWYVCFPVNSPLLTIYRIFLL